MKTIRVKKENFDIDGFCDKITEAVMNDLFICEGIIHPAIIDYFYSSDSEECFDEFELDYDTAKEQLYKGNMKLAFIFATKGSQDNYVACANGKEYKIESIDVGVLTVPDETCNVLYIECDGDYIYISTAHYGANCMGRATILKEENWGELDDIVLDFIKSYIKDGEDEIKSLPR